MPDPEPKAELSDPRFSPRAIPAVGLSCWDKTLGALRTKPGLFRLKALLSTFLIFVATPINVLPPRIATARSRPSRADLLAPQSQRTPIPSPGLELRTK